MSKIMAHNKRFKYPKLTPSKKVFGKELVPLMTLILKDEKFTSGTAEEQGTLLREDIIELTVKHDKGYSLYDYNLLKELDAQGHSRRAVILHYADWRRLKNLLNTALKTMRHPKRFFPKRKSQLVLFCSEKTFKNLEFKQKALDAIMFMQETCDYGEANHQFLNGTPLRKELVNNMLDDMWISVAQWQEYIAEFEKVRVIEPILVDSKPCNLKSF